MAFTYVTGFPRIGENRELKFVLEDFWAKKRDFSEVQKVAKELRAKHWNYQKEANISYISSNDFSFYDGMLDCCIMLGAIPDRFKEIEDSITRYFAMARGDEKRVAMAMLKWFNTNYHYIVPELSASMSFNIDTSKIKNEYNEAKALGIKTKINIIGPLTFLLLSKSIDGSNPLSLFDRLLEAYVGILKDISSLDNELVVQFDEPIFAKDTNKELLKLLKVAYESLSKVASNIKIAVVTYFDRANELVEALKDVNIWAIGLDFVYGYENIKALDNLGDKMLIAGVIDGRNVWKDKKGAKLLSEILKKIPKEKIIISTSCSLLHVPYSLRFEDALKEEVKSKLSFALEKLEELKNLANAFENNELKAIENETDSSRIKATPLPYKRSEYIKRSTIQKEELKLPLLPTTTIGSFPQTKEIRALRASYKKGEISKDQYEAGIKSAINDCIRFQENIGLDVLVHGEFERNDMVEYFGELLDGFAFSKNGWVQSYGSRCVKPPLLYASVKRRDSLGYEWILYAQSQTNKIVKGMLTGPVTILNWSFVRDDIPKSEVAFEVAQALSQEIDELQKRGIKIIQVDEAAFKEGYPLRSEKVKDYEAWAIESFKSAVSTAWDKTQIHTHMCYSDFNDIIKSIEALDADVITIETSRNGNRLLDVFKRVDYKAQIGPGVYDIHSPRIPSKEEIKTQIKSFFEVFPKEKLWVNPDCGLKTRNWPEVKEALKNMVEAAKELR